MQIALAPMEGLVDEILRDVLTRVGGIDWCVTEFIRITDRLLPATAFHKLAPEPARRQPDPRRDADACAVARLRSCVPGG